MNRLILTAAFLLIAPPAFAQTIKDEVQVPPYTLPPVLQDRQSRPVRTKEEWQAWRPELLKQFAEKMYGVTPFGRPEAMKFVVREEKRDARGGRATRLRVGVLFEGTESGRKMELLVYLPNDVTAKAPVFLGLNFDGNYTIVTDPDLPVPTHYANGLFDNKLPDHRPTEAGRGLHAYMWSLDVLLESGCGLATAACGEIEPDAPGRWQEGVRGLGKEPGPGDWGAIGAWAWGLSRAMDYLVTNDRVDPDKVAVMGFSRLGKAAMWAGAQDERFAAVISNASGAGGIALSKRIFGERVQELVTRFPHWFCGNFAAYAGKEETLPFDQHQLAALIAPRPLLATSGTEDLWSDPTGEYLSLKEASPVYELLESKGLDTDSPPQAGKLINSRVGYFLRKGGHDVTLEDWRAMLSFAGKHLKVTSPPIAALERYSRRLGWLPASEKATWETWLARSDAQRRRHDEQLAAEVQAAGLAKPNAAPSGPSFEMEDNDKTVPLTEEVAARLTANMLSWQLPCGGWSKAVSYESPRTPGTAWTSGGDPNHYAGTLDNRSTTQQLRFLAARQSAAPDDKIKASVERGIDYLLEAQFPNGAWPQNYPLEGGYHDSITLNDDAMMHAIELLMDAAAGKDRWVWLDAGRKTQAATAAARGVKALLKLQVKVNDQPTVWAAQYDPLTLQPVSARGYELAALSGAESVSVLRLLFKVRPVTPELTTAVDAAMAWFATHQIEGHPDGWARFYDINTQKPFFPGKLDGKAWPTEEAMRKSNPGGYDFFVKKPKDLPKWHAKWLKTLAKER
jgi:PelA/Pel-15E family pectate lyase